MVDHTRKGNVVSEDLWGMAPHASIPCGLLRNEGRSLAEGLSAALDAVQSRQIWWASPGYLPAPGFVRYLGDTLELSELDLVLCDRIRCDDSGRAVKLESPRPRSRSLEKTLRKGHLSWKGGIVMSRDAIDRAGGPDPDAGAAALEDLILRVAAAGPGGVVPLPLLLA
ncbi:MAG: hypothetical protein KDB53_05370 [Planctomycetes bacterium]|nr:hypothetical protein [Planctomycetota bacterium]